MLSIPHIIKTYNGKFKNQLVPHLFQAPGRVNLIGDHTDYNEGFVLPVTIDRRIIVAASIRQDTQINVYAFDFDRWDSFDFQNKISRLKNNTWGNYIRGMVWTLLQQGFKLKGMDAVIAGNIPIGAGLSSSAAMEVAVGFTLLQLSKAEVDHKSLALAAQKAENEFVGMRCGIMDQFIASLGQINNALLIDCRDLSYEAVPLSSRAQIVVVDSGVHRGLTDMEYNDRRSVCEKVARHFGITTLRDIDLETLKSRSQELGPDIYNRAHHVITENARTLSAAEALRADDLNSFGDLMIASHKSLRDDFEVSCPELDLLVDIALNIKGVYGARMTGGGFGGCMVSLVEPMAVDDLIVAVNKQYSQVSGRRATVYICNSSEGVSELESL